MKMVLQSLLLMLLALNNSLARAEIFQELYMDELSSRTQQPPPSAQNPQPQIASPKGQIAAPAGPSEQQTDQNPKPSQSPLVTPQVASPENPRPLTEAQEVSSGPQSLPESDAEPKRGIGYKTPTYGAVLPKNVLRINVNNTTAHADGGFDGDGKKVNPGLVLDVQANPYAVQYGISDRITVLAGFAHYNTLNLSVSDALVRKNEIYSATMSQQKATIKAAAIANARRGLADSLAAQGVCPSPAVCSAAIESGQVSSLPIDVTRMGYKAGNNLQAALDAYGDSVASVYEPQIDQGIRSAFASKAGGAPGAGDLESGLAYSFVNRTDVHLSTAVALRLPTGRYKKVPLGLPTAGTGKTTLSLLGLADVQVFPSIWFSATWRIEQDLSKSAERGGLVTRNKFNDHAENIYLSFAPGALTPWFKALLLTVGQNFQERSSLTIESTVDGLSSKSSFPAANLVSRVVTEEIDLTQYGLPLMLTHSESTPISGRNVTFATRKEEVNAIAYWKF